MHPDAVRLLAEIWGLPQDAAALARMERAARALESRKPAEVLAWLDKGPAGSAGAGSQ